MKFKKYNFLLSISALATIVSIPIVSTSINRGDQNNLVTKNNQTTQASNDATTSANNTTAPGKLTINDDLLNTLAPKISDNYNDYSFSSGYIIISDTGNNTKINFYNWFKQNIWTFDFAKNAASLFGSNKTVSTVKVKGGLNADGTFDNKRLFVYGNFANNQGAYLFLLDMTNGSLIKLSASSNALVSSPVPNQSQIQDSLINPSGANRKPQGVKESNAANAQYTQTSQLVNQTVDNTLVTDANLLTVVDANTLILTEKNATAQTNITNITTYNPCTFSFSIINLNASNNASIESHKYVYLGNTSDPNVLSYGELIGAMYQNNKFIFSFKALFRNSNNSSTYSLNIYNYYFVKDPTSNVVKVTPYTPTHSVTQSSSNTAFDFLTFNNSISATQIKSSGSVTPSDMVDFLNNKTSFSVKNLTDKNTGNSEMLISMDWDKTGLTTNAATDGGLKKILVSQLSNTANVGPTDATYTLPTTNASGLSWNSSSSVDSNVLGISNIIYSRVKDVAPYAVVMGKGTVNSAEKIWFSLVPLDKKLDTSNVNTNLDPFNVWVPFDDYNDSNIRKDWKIDFIPGNGIKNSDNSTTYYGYLQTDTADSDGTKIQSSNTTYFSVSSTNKNSNFGFTKMQNVFEFGITDSQLQAKYQKNDNDLSNLNSWITDDTKTNLQNDLLQAVEVDLSNTSSPVYKTENNLIDTNSVKNNLVIDENAATVSGSISYNVKNWWNSESTNIVKNVNIAFNNPKQFAFNLTGAADKQNYRTRFIEYKYNINDFDITAFLNDAIDDSTLGSELKTILLNSINGQNQSTTNNSVKLQDSTSTTTNPTTSDADTSNTNTDTATTDTNTNTNNNNDNISSKYLTLTKDIPKNTVTVNYDITSLKIPDFIISTSQQKGSIQYSGFADTTKKDLTFAQWADMNNLLIPGVNDHQNNQNNTPSSNVALIVGIAVAVIVVIAIVIMVGFILKKYKKNIQ